MKRIYTISGLLLLFTFFSTVVLAQNITVKGKVTDAKTGEALIGVTVAVKGTTTGTQTDVNGAYSLGVAVKFNTTGILYRLHHAGYCRNGQRQH
jgi:glycerol uptake facilitator-like aquaporin